MAHVDGHGGVMTTGASTTADADESAGPSHGAVHRATVVAAAYGLAVLSLVMAPLNLVFLTGPAGVAMPVVALVCSVVCLWAARAARQAPGHRVDGYLFVICAAPLVHSVVQIALTRRLEHTAALMLAIVAVAALNPRGRQVAVGATLSCAVWVTVVVLEAPFLRDQLLVTAFQLALACALAAAVFQVRAAVLRRLTSAYRRLGEQVTELETLRASAELGHRRFRNVFEDSPVGIGLSDEHGHFVEANEALCTLLGRTWSELEGRSSAEFTHPDDLSSHADAGRLIGESADGFIRIEKRYVRPTGEVRWAWLTLRNVAGPDRETWTLAHVQDVTERRQGDEELLRSREGLRASVEIARATQEGRDPRPLVLDSVLAMAHATTASLVEPIGDGQLVVTATSGLENLVGVTIDLDETTATGHVWRTGEPLFVSQAQTNPMVSPDLLRQSGVTSLLWQPVGSDGHTTAILALGWDDEHVTVTDFERASVEAIAAEAAMALNGERMRQQLEQTVITDSLTGLLNRRGWDEQTLALTRQSQRTGEPFTIALADLDHFKAYNDTHGHVEADEALVAFARAARRSLRVVDVVARWGGEEFAIALRDTTGEAAAETLDRLRRSTPGGLTCSIGYAEVLPGETVAQCLSRADAALYRAKRDGRDRLEESLPPEAGPDGLLAG